MLLGFFHHALLTIQHQPPEPWLTVSKIMMMPGTMVGGGYRLGVLRADLKFKNALGMEMPPGLGMESYAVFSGTRSKATAYGQFCLRPFEVNPVIDALRAERIQVTSLHNHALGDEPAMLFLHFAAAGEAARMASALKPAFDLVGRYRPLQQPENPPTEMAVDWGKISRILGATGREGRDGVRTYLQPNSDELGRASFYPCPCHRMMMMGDVAGSLEQIQRAIDALRRRHIDIDSIYTPLPDVRRPVLVVHFEGEGKWEEMAIGVRESWNQVVGQRP